MGRSKHCRICDHPEIATINSQIEAGVRQKAIHESFPQFSVSQISRHSRHLAPATADLTHAPASRDHALWLRRAEETFLRASADGDTKSAGQAISVAVRALTAMHKKQAEEAEAEKADVDDRYSIGAIDQSLREFMAQRDSERGGIGAKSACLCQEEPKFGELVLIIWSDRRLLETLLIHAKNCAVHIADGFIPPRETQNVTAND